MSSQVGRRALMTLALAALGWFSALMAANDFSWPGSVAALSGRNPLLALPVALGASLLALAVSGAAPLRADLRTLWKQLDRAGPWVAALAAVSVFAVGVRWGTFAVGGSDSYCYVSQAELIAQGKLRLDEPLARIAPWPAAEQTFTPVGYLPGETPGSAIPICPVGLPLLMAPLLKIAGPLGVFLLVPVAGALAVWWTFVLGRGFEGPRCGMLSAIFLASSPVFLYQVMQPMSDVPATAAWLLALVLATRTAAPAVIGAGAATCLALLIRPNLVAIAAVVAAFVGRRMFRRTGTVMNSAFMKHVAVVLCGALIIAGLQVAMHGSPLRSGYGSLGELFAIDRILPNLTRYTRWTIETQTFFLVLVLMSPLLGSTPMPDGRPARRFIRLAFAVIAAVVASYLPYLVFDAWWYLRFLLPGLPLAIILATASAVALVRLLPRGGRAVVVIVGTCVLASWYVHTAHTRAAFALQRIERRFIDTGRYVATRLPERAAILTVNQSGSIRYYAHRVTLTWDALDPSWLDRALEFLQAQGYTPYFVLEGWEEQDFKARFGGRSVLGTLDWPPRAHIDENVRIYDPADRARYFSGQSVPTDRVWLPAP